MIHSLKFNFPYDCALQLFMTQMIDKKIQHDAFLQRQKKLATLKVTGDDYPNDFQRDHLFQTVITECQNDSDEILTQKNMSVRVAGRIMQQRVMGKASFLDLQDMSGRLQIYIRETEIQLKQAITLKMLDLGDIIGIEGRVFRTKTKALSIRAEKLFLLTKSLRPLPDKFHKLQDTEICYRQRYIDLIANPERRSIFQMRAKLLNELRLFFDQQGYLEVETPMMQPLVGGALARPFITHHNALNIPLYLRVAPELYLKRLVVGGLEKVYEINRSFRNEGLSTRHNPEFTMLEFYEAYSDYQKLMDIVESLIKRVVKNILGQDKIDYQNEHYDFSKAFTRLTLAEALVQHHDTLSTEILYNEIKLKEWIQQQHITVVPQHSLGELQFALFEETVEHTLRQPTFVIAHPVEVSPLAKRNIKNPSVTDRFEFYIGGREIANGFSELNDPQDQAERFKAQLRAKESGSLETMHYDQDYITALEYGLPPTAGTGIGIDRLMMLLANVTSIRDVILFPLLRPLEK